jgi:hypothetical protein
MGAELRPLLDDHDRGLGLLRRGLVVGVERVLEADGGGQARGPAADHEDVGLEDLAFSHDQNLSRADRLNG